MNITFAALVAIVYSLVESLEKFGLKRKYAHILAIPIGIAVSLLAHQCNSVVQYICHGLLLGLSAIGTCDTFCNIFEVAKKKQ